MMLMHETPHAKQSLSSATAARDERIKQILTTGVQEKRISSTDVDIFNKLRTDFNAHNDPEIYKAMQEIIEKAREPKKTSRHDNPTTRSH